MLAHDAGAVGVIDIEHGIVAFANLVELGQRRQGAGHAVDAVDGDHGHAIRGVVTEDAVEVGRVAVMEGQRRAAPLAWAILAPS